MLTFYYLSVRNKYIPVIRNFEDEMKIIEKKTLKEIKIAEKRF